MRRGEEKFLGLCEINTFHAFSFFHFLLLTSYDDWIQFDSCSASQHLLPLLLNQFILFFLLFCLTSFSQPCVHIAFAIDCCHSNFALLPLTKSDLNQINKLIQPPFAACIIRSTRARVSEGERGLFITSCIRLL